MVDVYCKSRHLIFHQLPFYTVLQARLFAAWRATVTSSGSRVTRVYHAGCGAVSTGEGSEQLVGVMLQLPVDWLSYLMRLTQLMSI